MADSFLVSSEFAGELQETVVAVRSMVGGGDSVKKLPVDNTEGIDKKTKGASQHVASFSGSWAKGTTKSVTVLELLNGGWSETSQTLQAYNLFATLPSSGSCFVSKESTSSQYIVVAAECS